jgi:Rrf2 family protein
MKNEQFSSALYILMVLARGQNKKLSSREMASGLKTNPVVVRRLMAQLAESGLIESRKGRDGGVWLAQDPNKVTLADIYKAVSSREMISDFDRPKTKSCPVSCSMKKIVHSISSQVEKDLHKSLSQFRLSDLMKGIEA